MSPLGPPVGVAPLQRIEEVRSGWAAPSAGKEPGCHSSPSGLSLLTLPDSWPTRRCTVQIFLAPCLLGRPADALEDFNVNTLLARAARNPRTVCGVYFIASAIRNYLPIGASATYAALAPSLPGSGGYHAAHQAKHHRE